MLLTVNGAPLTLTAVVQANGLWSLQAAPVLSAGDTVAAHSGSLAGPSSQALAALTALPTAAPTTTAVPVAGGATYLSTNAPPGSSVVVVDSTSGGTVLGSGSVPASGTLLLQFSAPVAANQQLAVVVDGALQNTVATGTEGSPAQVQAGALPVDGGTIQVQGTPGSVVQLVDSKGNVLGSAVVGAQGTAGIVVHGVTAGDQLKILQNGVAAPLTMQGLSRGAVTAYLSTNVFNPLRGGQLGIGFVPTADEHMTVKVFNLKGELVKEVADLQVSQGQVCSATWDGRNLGGDIVASGVYIISFYGPATRVTKKVIVLK